MAQLAARFPTCRCDPLHMPPCCHVCIRRLRTMLGTQGHISAQSLSQPASLSPFRCTILIRAFAYIALYRQHCLQIPQQAVLTAAMLLYTTQVQKIAGGSELQQMQHQLPQAASEYRGSCGDYPQHSLCLLFWLILMLKLGWHCS